MSRCRWLLGASVALLVVTIVVGAMWWRHSQPRQTRASWEAPPQVHLSSMHAMPVIGWRTATRDLGLPPDATFVTAPTPAQSAPLVGFIGDRSYFLATQQQTHDWWLVAIDIRTGSRLFPPVPLTSDTPYQPDCYLNGPASVLCLRPKGQSYSAWVIDAVNGNVTYNGTTPLTQSSGHNSVDQVGIYAVVSEEGRGTSGVGQRAQPTWFVGGDGKVNQRYRAQSDLGDPTLATQAIGGADAVRKVVFTLADGKLLMPELGPGRQSLDAAVYPGGFAIEAGPASRLGDSDEILFFNDRGQQVARVKTSGTLATQSRDVPIVVTPQGSTVYTTSGTPLLRISSDAAEPNTVLIGSRLFVNSGGGSAFPEWTQYDLRTGRQGPICPANIGNYIGTDGAVAILRILDPVGGRVAKAVDLATCETLWTLNARAESQAQVWRVNTALVQLSDDGTELMSLVPPNAATPGPAR